MTEKTLGRDISGPARIVSFKEDVASEWAAARGIWATAEREWDERDMEWHFGFELPAPLTSASISNSTTTVSPNAAVSSESLKSLLAPLSFPSSTDLPLQSTLLAAGKSAVENSFKAGSKNDKKRIREVVEAWNLADTEAWRFVRAFAARSRVERAKWEEEERKFAGGEEGEGRGEGWGRWFDR